MRQPRRLLQVNAVRFAALLALGLCASACSSVSSVFSTDNADKASAAANTVATGNAEIAADEVPCPDVTVRTGAATLPITGKGKPGEAKDTSALDLRYQGSIVRTARECRVAGGVMNMKVGIEGRIVLGPTGGPGQVEVPIRIAVVREGPEPRTVTSKLVRVPVAIGENVDHVNFSHVDQEIAFPLPRVLGEMDSYVVYVGYDPLALQPEKPKAKPRRKR